MAAAAADLPAVLDRIDADLDQSLQRLFSFMRIASISTDPAYADSCRAAAAHLAKDLASLGFATDVRETSGHPVVIGRGTDGSGPNVLFYGHYDVQPVDPLDLWETPPFEPRISTLDGDRKIIVGRGACDDKGQVMTFVEACRAWKAVTGKLPVPITMMIEGEEECGSKGLFEFVRKNASEFRGDLALVCDTGMWNAETPAITTSLRGLLYEEVKIRAANRDLHSGLFGGAAQNPIRVLAKILAALHDDQGRVMVPGFYDGVHELPADIKADLASLNLTVEDFLGPGWAFSSRRRERTGLLSSRYPRARRVTPTGSWAATPAKVPRPSSPVRLQPRCRSAWSAIRTQRRSRPRSALSCANVCRRIVRWNSSTTRSAQQFNCRTTILRSSRRARHWAMNGAARP